MVQKFAVFFIITLSGVLAISENVRCQSTMGARSLATGQTGVALADDHWAVFANPAMMTTHQRQVSFYGFRYVGIAEITDFSAAAVIPAGNSSFGAAAHRYGFELFNETRIRLGAKHQWESLHAGAIISYNHVQQGGGYGSAGAVGVDLGLGAQILDQLWFGARATNVNQPAYDGEVEELPRELVIGLAYQPLSTLLILTDLVKDVRFPLSVRAGVEAELISGVYARTGITTRPETYAGGFGIRTSGWQINFGVQQHIPLGLSPAIELALSM